MGKKKLLALMLAIMVGLSFSFVAMPNAYAGHVHTYKTSYKTYCQKYHTVTKKCTKCGHVKSSVKKAHNYKYVSVSDFTSRQHSYTYKCSLCGNRKMVGANHTWKNGKCTVCGYVKGAKG